MAMLLLSTGMLMFLSCQYSAGKEEEKPLELPQWVMVRKIKHIRKSVIIATAACLSCNVLCIIVPEFNVHVQWLLH